jgi:hypothetical protein
MVGEIRFGLRRAQALLTLLILLAVEACTAGGEPSSLADTTAPTDTAPPEGSAGEWRWLGFPESRCANGTPTGVAINAHPNAKHLVMFLQGGGACVDGDSCWVHPAAANIASGYGIAQFGSEPLLSLPIFQRDTPANVFSDATYVFVPYCTGDLHAGDNIATYEVEGAAKPTYHYGARNLDVFLRALAPAFPTVDHVWLVGESAGGFGTLFNQDAVARAFGARTDVIDDSGPGMGETGFPPSWAVRLPVGCADCSAGLASLFLFDRARYPDARFGFLSFQVDDMLPGFYGVSQRTIVQALTVYEQSFARVVNTHAFVAPGTGHVVLGSNVDPETAPEARAWLQQMASDDPAWADVGGE